MRKLSVYFLIICCLVIPVSGMEFTAPTAPEYAQPYMPDETETFAQGLLHIITSAIGALRPEFRDVFCICTRLIISVLLLSVANSISGDYSSPVRLVGSLVIGVLLLEPVNTMIQLGTDTVVHISEYGKMLLPVLTAAVAAQGGTTSSAAMYIGTVFFDSLLTSVIAKFIVPALYVFLCLSVAESAIEHALLKKMCDFIKWLMTWCMKIILYVFTGYIGITGIISGSVDASMLKATKLTISGMVPVVGGILADASETILISAGLMKNAAGVYGILAVIAICVVPFLQIGCHYFLLKISAAICNVFGYKPAAGLVNSFMTGMGFVLAMTGTVCMLLLISLVCFIKGMS